ncbi:cellulose biosynthesis protein BcsS [Bosea sp. (in: a-proteobacteria)]|uniref:cellulose biosynthesis protein BcsS n=1 Tax=Bosea sp. (in: a-proteobacteria) TaxID=1871050 RepID=UPI0025C5ABC5|nr:cellulose biosynthesis protein BcsS [Bosea sp. (in: a-proteobacteria)]MBR3192848.1 cellulose biosynthesis protein BcsS [Bosea sp. (in: a-proteobacteria)]
MAWGVAGRWGLLARGFGAAVALASSPAKADPALMERSPLSLAIFGSLEADASKTYGSVGLKWAFGNSGGLDASGFRLGLKWGASVEPARRRPTQGHLYRTEFNALLGYEWRIDDTFLTLSAGPEIEARYRETRDERSFEQRGSLRLQADLWSKPAENWLLQANAYAVPADRGRYWGRLAGGWRLIDEMYLGPEIESYRERDYHKLRLGLHLTGLHLFGLDWRLAGGIQKTSDEKAGAYLTLGLLWKR